MNLLEFITYCSVKGIVKAHIELDVGSYGAPTVCKYYQIHIQARGYTVKIEYTRYKDWTRIVQATVRDHGRSHEINYTPTLDEIIEAIIPNYRMASMVAQNESK